MEYWFQWTKHLQWTTSLLEDDGDEIDKESCWSNEIPWSSVQLGVIWFKVEEPQRSSALLNLKLQRTSGSFWKWKPFHQSSFPEKNHPEISVVIDYHQQSLSSPSFPAASLEIFNGTSDGKKQWEFQFQHRVIMNVRTELRCRMDLFSLSKELSIDSLLDLKDTVPERAEVCIAGRRRTIPKKKKCKMKYWGDPNEKPKNKEKRKIPVWMQFQKNAGKIKPS